MSIAPPNMIDHLSDAELVKYAAAQKAAGNMANFSLAFQTSQQRAKDRQLAAAQAQGMPKTDVADGALQQMASNVLPEETGIGALPVQNLQGMKEGGITGYAPGGTTYQPVSAEQVAAAQNVPNVDPNLLAQNVQTIAAPAQAETAAAYAPYQAELAAEKAKLAGNEDKNIQQAMLAAGLKMMSGTSPYAFTNIGQGGLEGLATYSAAQKADQEAKRSLMHSQMLAMQAERAERSGNRHDAVLLQDAADRQKNVAIQNNLTGLTLQNTSQHQAAQLGLMGKQVDIMQQNADTQRTLANARAGALNKMLNQDKETAAEYQKVVNGVDARLKNDLDYGALTPAQRTIYRNNLLHSEIINHPILGPKIGNTFGFQAQPGQGKVHSLMDDSSQED